MKKKTIYVCLTLLVTIFMTSCSSDDNETFGTGLIGKWDLIEVQNGPDGL